MYSLQYTCVNVYIKQYGNTLLLGKTVHFQYNLSYDMHE